jgi:signal transduction histidine kinase
MTPDINPSNQHYQRLLEIIQKLSSITELSDLLSYIVQTGKELTSCEECSLLLYDSRTETLRFVASEGGRQNDLGILPVPIENTLGGMVFQQGEPIHVLDVASDSRFDSESDISISAETRGILAVPLIFGERTIGVLEAINKEQNADFSDDDQRTLLTLSSQAAIGIENVRLVADLQRALNDLEDLDRMKTNFVSVASHELRTPLGLILGFATYMYTSCEDEENRLHLDAIIRNAGRLKEIIEDLTKIDSLSTGRASIRSERVSMAALIQNAVSTHQKSAAVKRINLNTKLPPGDLSLRGDSEKLNVVLDNLIKNAIDFNHEGGKVDIRAEYIHKFLQVSVSDTGIGIPSGDLPHIFDRFYQVEKHKKYQRKGMGLGLSVAKGMVELHGGRIWVESMEGHGSIISFVLPAEQPAEGAGLQTTPS